MKTFRKSNNIAGWIVFAVAVTVYYFSVERTGSLWDCGEFVLGAYKLQVVHPPGAPLFLLIGRLFAWIGETLSSNPSDIAFMVNLMSGICSAFAAAFIAWSTGMVGKLAWIGREQEPDKEQSLVLNIASIVAGLSTAFITSIWFSAVEGEVYAMSTFFTAMTVWAVIKFYFLPEGPLAEKWFVFSLVAAGLSIGVHLLSLLALPMVALLYYFKKYKKVHLKGVLFALLAGVFWLVFVQRIVIAGIPAVWAKFDLFVVNTLGMPINSGAIPLSILLGGMSILAFHYANKKKSQLLQNLAMAATLTVIGFSLFGVVVIRANTNTPVNMNNPSDPMRLLPYLNREQYGERALLRGTDFTVGPPIRYDQEARYGKVGDHYEIVDYKLKPVYKNSDKKFFPRMQDNTQGRPALYRKWLGNKKGKPTFIDHIKFFVRYQIGWMYIRYFMWNFTGRQNGVQGYYDWNEKDGNWISGIGFIDSMLHYNQSDLPDTIKNDKQRNRYYFIPFLLGIFGLLFHYNKNKRDFLALLVLFLLTGLGIILYSNQPPNEPRERDYVLVGSFMTYCIWIGFGVIALYRMLQSKMGGKVPLFASAGLGLVAPLLLVTQNFDDHSRRLHSGARDYAINFLESCDPNAIIFTYGDNDTYPLWYAQEVEGIRTDVRVANLSLINVDWYINQLRRKVNDSPPVKMSLPPEAYRGNKRTQIPVIPSEKGQAMDLRRALKVLAQDRPDDGRKGAMRIYGVMPASNLVLPIDEKKARKTGLLKPTDTIANPRIEFKINQRAIYKGDMAILDIIASNIYDRPIYFSVTSQQEKLLGAIDFTQLEGLSLRLVPIKSKSNKNFYIYGNGRVDTEKVYDRIMNKFRWGGFDKEELYVDHSYTPSTSALRMVFWRTINALIEEGKKEKAANLAEKYFEAFPHKNFPYDARVIPFINALAETGRKEEAKKHLSILADEAQDFMLFFDSLDEEDLQGSWGQSYGMWRRAVAQIFQISRFLADQEFLDTINAKLGEYKTLNIGQ